MKNNNILAMKKSSSKDIYLLVPHPFTSDLCDIIKEFNKHNKEIDKGFVVIDLETIIGNRKGKFVLLNIVNFKLIRSTLQEFDSYAGELEKFKIEYYSTLNKRIIKHLFPLKLRNNLLKIMA